MMADKVAGSGETFAAPPNTSRALHNFRGALGTAVKRLRSVSQRINGRARAVEQQGLADDSREAAAMAVAQRLQRTHWAALMNSDITTMSNLLCEVYESGVEVPLLSTSGGVSFVAGYHEQRAAETFDRLISSPVRPSPGSSGRIRKHHGDHTAAERSGTKREPSPPRGPSAGGGPRRDAAFQTELHYLRAMLRRRDQHPIGGEGGKHSPLHQLLECLESGDIVALSRLMRGVLDVSTRGQTSVVPLNVKGASPGKESRKDQTDGGTRSPRTAWAKSPGRSPAPVQVARKPTGSTPTKTKIRVDSQNVTSNRRPTVTTTRPPQQQAVQSPTARPFFFMDAGVKGLSCELELAERIGERRMKAKFWAESKNFMYSMLFGIEASGRLDVEYEEEVQFATLMAVQRSAWSRFVFLCAFYQYCVAKGHGAAMQQEAVDDSGEPLPQLEAPLPLAQDARDGRKPDAAEFIPASEDIAPELHASLMLQDYNLADLLLEERLRRVRAESVSGKNATVGLQTWAMVEAHRREAVEEAQFDRRVALVCDLEGRLRMSVVQDEVRRRLQLMTRALVPLANVALGTARSHVGDSRKMRLLEDLAGKRTLLDSVVLAGRSGLVQQQLDERRNIEHAAAEELIDMRRTVAVASVRTNERRSSFRKPLAGITPKHVAFMTALTNQKCAIVFDFQQQLYELQTAAQRHLMASAQEFNLLGSAMEEETSRAAIAVRESDIRQEFLCWHNAELVSLWSAQYDGAMASAASNLPSPRFDVAALDAGDATSTPTVRETRLRLEHLKMVEATVRQGVEMHGILLSKLAQQSHFNSVASLKLDAEVTRRTEAEEQFGNMVDECERLRLEVASLRALADDRRSRIEELEAEAEDRNLQLVAYSERYFEERSSEYTACRHLQQSVDELTAQRQHLNTQITAMRDQLEGLAATNERLEVDAGQRAKELQLAAEQQEEAKLELHELQYNHQHELLQHRSEVAVLREEVARVTAENGTLQQQLDAYAAKEDELVAEKFEEVSDCRRMQERCLALETRVAELEDQLEGAQEQCLTTMDNEAALMRQLEDVLAIQRQQTAATTGPSKSASRQELAIPVAEKPNKARVSAPLIVCSPSRTPDFDGRGSRLSIKSPVRRQFLPSPPRGVEDDDLATTGDKEAKTEEE